jgi:hypothetical protein
VALLAMQAVARNLTVLAGNQQKEIMKYVVRIEAEAKGFRLIDLFGKTYSSREPSKSLNS